MTFFCNWTFSFKFFSKKKQPTKTDLFFVGFLLSCELKHKISKVSFACLCTYELESYAPLRCWPIAFEKRWSRLSQEMNRCPASGTFTLPSEEEEEEEEEEEKKKKKKKEERRRKLPKPQNQNQPVAGPKWTPMCKIVNFLLFSFSFPLCFGLRTHMIVSGSLVKQLEFSVLICFEATYSKRHVLRNTTLSQTGLRFCPTTCRGCPLFPHLAPAS